MTNHAELYLTWSSNLLALISRSVNLKKRAKGAARLAARSVRTNRGKNLIPKSLDILRVVPLAETNLES